MPIKIEKKSDGGVIFNGSGKMEGSETVRFNKKLYSDPETIRSIRYQLVDLRQVTDFSATPSEMKVLARQDSEAFSINPEMIIAIVMSDDLAYGMNRIYAGYFQGNDESVRLFRDIEEAKTWIRSKFPNTNP